MNTGFDQDTVDDQPTGLLATDSDLPSLNLANLQPFKNSSRGVFLIKVRGATNLNPNLPGELYLTFKASKMLIRTKSVHKVPIVILSYFLTLINIVGASVSAEAHGPIGGYPGEAAPGVAGVELGTG